MTPFADALFVAPEVVNAAAAHDRKTFAHSA
jgi:hypothetical protein